MAGPGSAQGGASWCSRLGPAPAPLVSCQLALLGADEGDRGRGSPVSPCDYPHGVGCGSERWPCRHRTPGHLASAPPQQGTLGGSSSRGQTALPAPSPPAGDAVFGAGTPPGPSRGPLRGQVLTVPVVPSLGRWHGDSARPEASCQHVSAPPTPEGPETPPRNATDPSEHHPTAEAARTALGRRRHQ